MRSKVRPARNHYWRYEWHPWFAWRPKKVYLGPYPTTDIQRPYLWVWWENIDRRRNPNKFKNDPERDPSVDGGDYQYRIKPRPDEISRSSTDFETMGDKESEEC